MNAQAPTIPSTQSAAEGRHAQNLALLDACIICNAVHPPGQKCNALQNKVKLRIALDNIGVALKQANDAQAVRMLTLKRAFLLEQLRKLEVLGMQR